MTLVTHINKVGKYPVIQIPCPSFKNELVDLKAPRAGVLHTTEGGWDGSMQVFHTHFAPHFIIGVNAHALSFSRMKDAHVKLGVENDKFTASNVVPPEPKGNVEIAQLVPVGTIGAALVTHNNLAIVQIEMVGYSREEPWLPEAETLDLLASLMLVCRDTWGIPLSRPWPSNVYGRAGKTDHRNDGHFGKTAGWFSHGDVPSPDSHWDCGAIRWDSIFEYAKSLDTPKLTS